MSERHGNETAPKPQVPKVKKQARKKSVLQAGTNNSMFLGVGDQRVAAAVYNRASLLQIDDILSSDN